MHCNAVFYCYFFFFKQKTAYEVRISDWSSDVCSSDLDSLPDVTPLGNTWIPEFALLDALAPLDERIAATPGIDVDDYYPGAWDSGVIDGVTYAVPWYVETRLPFFRTDILREAGTDSTFVAWAQWRHPMTETGRAVWWDRRCT